jgi:hypothetical protein
MTAPPSGVALAFSYGDACGLRLAQLRAANVSATCRAASLLPAQVLGLSIATDQVLGSSMSLRIRVTSDKSDLSGLRVGNIRWEIIHSGN